MKSVKKKNELTLENIGKLMDKKLAPVLGALGAKNGVIPNVYDQLTKLNTSVVGIYGEIDGVKQQIVNLDSKVDDFRKETNDTFQIVLGGLDDLGRAVDKDLDPRLRRAEQKLYAGV